MKSVAKRGAGLMPAAVAEIKRLQAEWAALKHSDLLSISNCGKEKLVLKPRNNNRPPTNKKTKPAKTKSAMSLSKPMHSDILVGVVALVEVGSEHRSLNLRSALSALGASVVANWSALVTHVVWGEGGSTSIRAKARTYAAKLVSPLWVEACVRTNDWLPERAFPTATRDSDLPSPRTVYRLLQEADSRKVPLHVVLAELTGQDGASSSEPGTEATTTRSAADMPGAGNHGNNAVGRADDPESRGKSAEQPGNSGSINHGADKCASEGAGDLGGCRNRTAVDNPTRNNIRAAGRHHPRLAAEPTTTTDNNPGAKIQTAEPGDQSPGQRAQGNQGSPREQADSNTADPLAEEDAGKDPKEALRPGGDTAQFEYPFEKDVARYTRAAQSRDNDDKASSSCYSPGSSDVRPGPSWEGADLPPGKSDRKVYGSPRQNDNSERHVSVPADDEEPLPPDPADRLGAKPKIRQPPKQKKSKKKKPDETPPPATNPPATVPDYATEEISHVNTMPRRALPVSLSPSPPRELPPSPPPRVLSRRRNRHRTPPRPPSRSPTPPLHGHRRWPPKNWTRAPRPPSPSKSSSSTFRPITSRAVASASGISSSRSPTPPLHGRRHWQVRQPPMPRDRYASPTPGPSQAPHVPPQLKRSPSPGLSRGRYEFPSAGPSRRRHRSPAPGPSRRHQKSPSPGPSSGRYRSPSPGPSRRRPKSQSPGQDRSRSPQGPTPSSRPRYRLPLSSRAWPYSESPSTSTRSHKPMPTLRVAPLPRVTPPDPVQDPEEDPSRPPFPERPRTSSIRRPRSTSTPNLRSPKPKPHPQPTSNVAAPAATDQELIDDDQRDQHESESDSEPDPDNDIIWGLYRNYRRRRMEASLRHRPPPRRNGLWDPVPRPPPFNYYRGHRGVEETNAAENERELVLRRSAASSDPNIARLDEQPPPRPDRRALARAERAARRYFDHQRTPPPDARRLHLPLPILFPSRPRIVLTGMSTDERVRVMNACLYLGGRIQTRVTRYTTHVLVGTFGAFGLNADDVRVANGNLPQPITLRLRTVNSLAGAARGCRVLRAQWAFDSLDADAWLTHHQYLVLYLKRLAERAAAERHAFGLTRADYAYDVFNGRRVIISQECEHRDAVIELLALCGAVLYDHEGHIIRNQETTERLNVNRSIHIGHIGRLVNRPVPPRFGRTEDGDWAGSNLEPSGHVTLGIRPGEICPRWVYDSIAAGRMRSLRQYTIPQNG